MTSSPTFNSLRSDRDQPVVDLTSAPLPTARTLRKRQSMPSQAIRFVSFNIRMMRMVMAGDH